MRSILGKADGNNGNNGMNDDETAYRPVSCAFHDVLENHAMRKSGVLLRYFDHSGTACESRGVIVDVFAKDGADYLLTESGERLRLDRVISVDDVRLGNFPPGD